MKKIIYLTIVLAVGSIAGNALADDIQTSTRPWTDKGEVSLVSTNGNSRGTTTSIKNTFNYKWSEVTGVEIGAAGLGAKSGDTVTAENYHANEKVTKQLVGKNYVFERFGWDKDRFGGIRNRYDSSLGLGRALIDTATDKLNSEFGGGFVAEERTEAAENNYPSGRAYLKYIHQLSASSSFSQDAEYTHDFDAPRGYRLNTETAVTAALSTHLSLKASFDWHRNGNPPPGAIKDDTITSMALVVNY